MRCYLVTPFLVFILITQGFSSQAQQFRVKRIQREELTQQFGWLKTDSATFYYTGNAKGDVTWQWAENISQGWGDVHSRSHIQYDSVLNDARHLTIGPYKTYLDGPVLATQQHNAAGNVTFYGRYYHPRNYGKFQKIYADTNVYNGNELTEYHRDGVREMYYYQNGMLRTMEYLFFLNTSYNLYGTYTYDYDQAGNLEKIRYIRATSGDSAWTVFTYDNQNRLIARTELAYGLGSQADTTTQWLFIYDNNGDLVQEDLFWKIQAQTNSLYLKSSVYSTYDNQHRKTTLTSHYRDESYYPVEPKERRSITYDNNGLLTKLENQNWDGSQWISRADSVYETSSHIYTFEYEVVWPTTVPEVEDAANVKLYPSPASDFIRIETEWNNARPFTAAILDMQGRTIRQWNEPATKSYARTIPLTELPAGSYFIKLSSGKQQYTKQFIVYK